MHIQSYFIYAMLFLGLLTLGVNLQAQEVPAPTEVRLVIESDIQGAADPFAEVVVDSTAKTQAGLAVITLPQGDNSQQVLIKLGTSEGGSELFDGIFVVANNKSLPKGQSFRKVGDKLIIRLGKFSLHETSPGPLYLQVMLGDGKGHLSDKVGGKYE